jgi:hypothetical protein
LAPAKNCEAIAERGLQETAKRLRKEDEKMRLLREAAELFKTNWPEGLRENCRKTAKCET